jgi:hypothetical protein
MAASPECAVDHDARGDVREQLGHFLEEDGSV